MDKENKKNIDGGDIKVSENVIAAMVENAVLEADGVHGLACESTPGILNVIKGNKPKPKAIKINIDNNKKEVTIEVYVILNFGTNVIEISKIIQEKVKETIENMVGMNVRYIDVVVEGIYAEENA